jgi:3-hydroxybutyryl-CoA dehydrogenase
MTVAVLANEEMKKEFLERKIPDDTDLIWCDSLKTLGMVEADVYFDLLYRNDSERNAILEKIKNKTVFIGEVNNIIEKKYKFIRLNNWPGFLKRDIVELAVSAEAQVVEINEIFEKLGWVYRLVPDKPGFISARVVAMIINEAYYALGENVSTREDIDIAMKLGTNYPYGPFEWAKLIGLKNIYSLLQEMSRENERYQPAPAMKAEWDSLSKN